MKASPGLVIGLLASVLCLASPTTAQTSTTADLIAGQHILVGTFSATINGPDGLFEYRITQPGWCLGVTHLYLAQTPPIKAAPGRFPFHGEDGCTQSYTFEVPLGSLASSGFYLAAHAEVHRTSAAAAESPIIDTGVVAKGNGKAKGGRTDGGDGGNETAWAFGPFSLRTGWGWYSVVIFE